MAQVVACLPWVQRPVLSKKTKNSTKTKQGEYISLHSGIYSPWWGFPQALLILALLLERVSSTSFSRRGEGHEVLVLWWVQLLPGKRYHSIPSEALIGYCQKCVIRGGSRVYLMLGTHINLVSANIVVSLFPALWECLPRSGTLENPPSFASLGTGKWLGAFLPLILSVECPQLI